MHALSGDCEGASFELRRHGISPGRPAVPRRIPDGFLNDNRKRVAPSLFQAVFAGLWADLNGDLEGECQGNDDQHLPVSCGAGRDSTLLDSAGFP